MNEQQTFDLVVEDYIFEDDFCISDSNQKVYNYFSNWPSWDCRILNVFGPRMSGKTFLLTFFANKNSFLKIESKNLNQEILDKALLADALILEDVNININEEFLFLIFNEFKNNNKFLVFSSDVDTSHIQFNLPDLSSRMKSILNLEILNPSDNLLYSILLKELSSRQISIKPELLSYIIKRIERTYSSVNIFVNNIDKASLQKKKRIDLQLINQVLSNI